MWDTYNEDKAPRADVGRIVRIAIFAAIGVIIFGIVANQSVNLLMNTEEFGNVFTKSLYYSTLSGVILSAISFVRVNFKSRHSVVWYGIRNLMNLLKRSDFASPTKALRYSEFQMSYGSFALWQLMKILLFAPLFSSIIFGMAAEYVMQGKELGLDALGNIFAIPFEDISTDQTYAQEKLIPMVPALTLLIPALLAAVGVRLLMYVGVSGTVNIVSQYAVDSKESKPKFLSYISTMELIAGAVITWIGFDMFFSGKIDYNTRYAISGALTLGAALFVYGFVDRQHAKVIIYPDKKRIYSRLFTVAVVVGLAGSIIVVNNSIAGTMKTELSEPYIAQQIEVNRYMYGLDQVQIVNYNIAQPAIQSSDIRTVVDQNADILNNVRLWDEKNAKEKLAQEISQRSDLRYSDFDLLRFGGSTYWAGSTVPVIPTNVAPSDEWSSNHMVYTHSNSGVKMLDADIGGIVDNSQFFEQRRIYYGESDNGLFSTYWSAYPVDRKDSREIGGYMYNGTGGIDVAPPLSWMFEPNFMVSYSVTPMHIMRYKDIHDRMELLYPQFVYEFSIGSTSTNPQFKDVDAFAVTDGTNTYWLMPLIVAINTSNVPWSSPPSFTLQHVGYSFIDAYDGTVRIIVTGDDFFSEIFLDQYKDIGATRDIPAWLADQIKYPEEMFIWQASKFNNYHVTDPKEYIEANFYKVADDPANEGPIPTYAFAKPQGFESPEFLGIQSFQLKNSESDNIVGFIAAQNDPENIGRMTFYSLPADSPAKLISVEGAQKELRKDPAYEKIKDTKFGNTNPPLGESHLQKVGNYEVYFIPIFTSTGSKQVGTVGAVGAASSTGAYHVGFGDTPALAFENYLQKLSGTAPPAQPSDNHPAPDRQVRIQNLEKVFTNAGLQLVKPSVVSAPVRFEEGKATYGTDAERAQAETAVRSFIENSVRDSERIFEWHDGTKVNFGVLRTVDGIVESHYIAIEVG